MGWVLNAIPRPLYPSGLTSFSLCRRSLVRSQLVSLEFFIDIKSFRSHYSPGVDSASNRNEYQEHFLGGKGGLCVRLILPPSCAVVMKSGNLNFLETCGPLQACNGTDLPLHSIMEQNILILIDCCVKFKSLKPTNSCEPGI